MIKQQPEVEPVLRRNDGVNAYTKQQGPIPFRGEIQCEFAFKIKNASIGTRLDRRRISALKGQRILAPGIAWGYVRLNLAGG